MGKISSPSVYKRPRKFSFSDKIRVLEKLILWNLLWEIFIMELQYYEVYYEKSYYAVLILWEILLLLLWETAKFIMDLCKAYCEYCDKARSTSRSVGGSRNS